VAIAGYVAMKAFCTVFIDGHRAKFEAGHPITHAAIAKIVKRRDPVVIWSDPRSTRYGRLWPGDTLQATDGLMIGTSQ
jgi:hypothetical protein